MYGLIARESSPSAGLEGAPPGRQIRCFDPGGTIRRDWFHAKIQNRHLQWSQMSMLLSLDGQGPRYAQITRALVS